MGNTFIMSDAVYEELYDVYLSFNAIQELVNTVPQRLWNSTL